MITKYDGYWHLYFRKECEDTPESIILTVEELFKEMKEMGDVCFVRCFPEIERTNLFEGSTRVVVFCRFSSIKPSSDIEEEVSIYGFGLSKSGD